MKTIGDAVHSIMIKRENTEPGPLLTISSEAIELVNELFETFQAIFPAFKQSWPNKAIYARAKAEWVKCFIDCEITNASVIKNGVKKVRSIGGIFVLSPGEFVKLCKPSPEEMGAPSIDSAYNEACTKYHPSYGPNKNWSHPAVKHAAERYGCEIHKGTIKETKSKFEKMYLESCQQYQDGKILNQLEDKNKDTPENRMLFQELFGGGLYKGKKPDYFSYLDWLKEK